MSSVNFKIGYGEYLSADHAAELNAILDGVNGKATAHTFHSHLDVMRVAKEAEAGLEALGIAKAHRPGAIFYATSGGKVAKAYKNSRIGTAIRLERRSSGWVLTFAATTTLWENQGGGRRLELTPEQDEAAIAYLRRSYTVQPRMPS